MSDPGAAALSCAGARWEHARNHRAAGAESGHDPNVPPRRENRAGVGERAQALVREPLANGPKPESQIGTAAEAADIPEPSLIAAADAIEVTG